MLTLETGFMDGKPVSCYTRLPCIEAWKAAVCNGIDEAIEQLREWGYMK